VRQELRDSDLKQIANTSTRDLVFPLYYLNGKSYQHPSRAPRFEFDITEAEDLKSFSDSLPSLVDIGFKIPARWAHEKLQIPEPQKDEPVLMRAAATANNTEAEKTIDKPDKKTANKHTVLKGLARITALKAKSDKALNEDTADLFTHQLTESFSPVLQGFNDEIEALVNKATSLEDLQEQLSSMDLSIDEASEVLQLALVASELGGMADVEDGE
jgi:phage gp29-like protein